MSSRAWLISNPLLSLPFLLCSWNLLYSPFVLGLFSLSANMWAGSLAVPSHTFLPCLFLYLSKLHSLLLTVGQEWWVVHRIVTLLGDRGEGTGLPTLRSSHIHKKTSLSPPSFLIHKYILKYQNAKIANTTIQCWECIHPLTSVFFFFKKIYH